MITLVTGTNQKNMGSNPRFGTHPTITKALRFFTFYVCICSFNPELMLSSGAFVILNVLLICLNTITDRVTR
jgi:hypothetical protein